MAGIGDRARRIVSVAMVLAVALVLSGCSKSTDTAGERSSKGSTTTGVNGGTNRECSPPGDTTPLKVDAVGIDGRDFDMVSFDGTRIRTHWFPNPAATPENPAPTVLMGPGWSLAGATDVNQSEVLGSIDIASLLNAGYNVATWDPRGFGASDGYATVDSAAFEGRDVQQLIDWLATLPGVELEAERNPRMGMVGGSYGGGIQLVTAAIDCRVDAIVPIVAWHSLRTSLYKSETVKIGWAGVLANAAATSKVDAHITSAWEAAQTTGVLSAEDIRWFIERGPGDMIEKVEVPTLLIHGTIDTLFTLDEAVTNYRILEKHRVPVAMLWNCDGHGVCLTSRGDPNRARSAAIGWLDRYVKDDKSVEVVSGFDAIDQNGDRYVADRYVGRSDSHVTAQGKGTLALSAEGGSGPLDPSTAAGQMLAGIAADLTPTKATNALNIEITDSEDSGGDHEPGTLLLGEPVVEVTYTGERSAETVDSAPTRRPTRVFAQLVDESDGKVVGNQVTPIKVVLDGKEHKARVPLEVISFSLKPQAKLTLQLVARTVAYATPELGGSIEFSSVEVKLPVGDWLKPVN